MLRPGLQTTLYKATLSAQLLLRRQAMRRGNLNGPLFLQIQTVTRCNGRCAFCPYPQRPAGAQREMEDALFLRILDGLREVKGRLVLAPMLQNEPLLDRNLAHRIKQARRVLGSRVWIMVVTNGSLLGSDRVRELVNSGANQIEVSLDAHSAGTYARLGKGLDFVAVTRNIQELLRQRGTVEIVVRYLRLAVNRDEEPSFVAQWKSLGARVRFLSPTNRAGWLPGLAGFRRTYKRSLFTPMKDVLKGMNPPCMDPFYKLNVLVDGRVILCCHDWGPTETVGDLSRQSLREVWCGKKMQHHRGLLQQGRWRESTVCKNCSNVCFSRLPAPESDGISSGSHAREPA